MVWWRGIGKINLRNKRLKEFKKSRFYNDKELYKKSKYDALKLIAADKQAFFWRETPRNDWQTQRIMVIS